jgi:hypothetical protein
MPSQEFVDFMNDPFVQAQRDATRDSGSVMACTIFSFSAGGRLAMQISYRDGKLAITVPDDVDVNEAARAVIEALRPMLASLLKPPQ